MGSKRVLGLGAFSRPMPSDHLSDRAPVSLVLGNTDTDVVGLSAGTRAAGIEAPAHAGARA